MSPWSVRGQRRSSDEGVWPVGRFEGRRLSLPRLAILLAIAVTVAFVGTSSWRQVQDAQAADSNGDAWYAAYVDATVTPLYEFEQPASRAARDVVLSFVVA